MSLLKYDYKVNKNSQKHRNHMYLPISNSWKSSSVFFIYKSLACVITFKIIFEFVTLSPKRTLIFFLSLLLAITIRHNRATFN